MDKELELKIKDLVSKIGTTNENEVRSMMVLIRKRMELMPEEERAHYLILNLFCNWVAHTQITKSITGLRTLVRINNALVSIKDSKDMSEISLTISMAVGFSDLKTEFERFIGNLGITTPSSNNDWINFMSHILAIIKDVPLAFPPLDELKDKELKIYEGIGNNAIKPGAGVIAILISEIDYGLFHEKLSVLKCLKIRTADTTTFIVPLTIKL